MKHCPPEFVPLDQESRTVVPTDCAAHHINRKPQTLRGWACKGRGPLNPVRLHGRLGWKVADLVRLVGGAQ